MLGLVSGIVVHAIDRAEVKGGIISSLVLGIAGAVLGGYLTNLFLGVSIDGVNPESILISVGGGLLLAILARFLFRDTGKIKTETTRMEDK